MKKTIAALMLPLALTGCWTVQEGEKHGVLVKVAKQGTIWGTYEGELIRGGISDASGANGRAFRFTFGQFKSKLVGIARQSLLQNKPVLLHYHCERFVAPWRGESNCFADSLQVLK
jgi:hypothetical protein